MEFDVNDIDGINAAASDEFGDWGTELEVTQDMINGFAELTGDQQHVYARYMEAFAAMLSHTDEQLGRVIDFLEGIGDLDRQEGASEGLTGPMRRGRRRPPRRRSRWRCPARPRRSSRRR